MMVWGTTTGKRSVEEGKWVSFEPGFEGAHDLAGLKAYFESEIDLVDEREAGGDLMGWISDLERMGILIERERAERLGLLHVDPDLPEDDRRAWLELYGVEGCDEGIDDAIGAASEAASYYSRTDAEPAPSLGDR